jgi:ABC-2 type transport system permease protein
MRVLLHVIVKELLQLRRDRRMIPIVLISPIVQLIAFGYAANLDVSRIPIVLVDRDRTAESRELLDRFLSSRFFELAGVEDAVEAVDPWLVAGKAEIALVIGSGYGKAVASGRSPDVQVIADGSDANSAVIGLGYAARIIFGKNSDLVREHLLRVSGPAGREVGASPGILFRDAGAAGGRAGPPAETVLVPRVWYNPDLLSRWYFVPAILAMVLMIMTMVLSAMGVVREKEIGTMEQIIVTPIRPWQLIAGKLFPFAVIGILNLFLITALAVWHFGVPLRGSFLLLTALTLLFLSNTLGLGLLVSTLVRTQQQAMLGSSFLIMVPMIYLSGLIFPIENMPPAVQYITYAIPLRYYAVIIRGIFLKGSGIAVLWPEAAVLGIFGVAAFTLASLRFRKRLD